MLFPDVAIALARSHMIRKPPDYTFQVLPVRFRQRPSPLTRGILSVHEFDLHTMFRVRAENIHLLSRMSPMLLQVFPRALHRFSTIIGSRTRSFVSVSFQHYLPCSPALYTCLVPAYIRHPAVVLFFPKLQRHAIV